ncbi:hypothetical protein DPX16_16734 [Anabarilius grahami]|uniref:Uncharacterized protein n=1 Tax=Anabarilius grahami TaxID=495550 RepID=A0A3N0YSC7_ANAGA|nr:hypothetical protein DPX16_16734 [Anabarilius grahami]
MIRWPDGPTSSDADSTCRIGRKKADEDQLQPTVQNTLRKVSRPTNKNCPTADRRLAVFDVALTCHALRTDEKRISPHEGPPIKVPDTGLKEDLTEGLLTPLSRRPCSFKTHFCLTSAGR